MVVLLLLSKIAVADDTGIMNAAVNHEANVGESLWLPVIKWSDGQDFERVVPVFQGLKEVAAGDLLILRHLGIELHYRLRQHFSEGAELFRGAVNLGVSGAVWVEVLTVQVN